MECLKLLHHQDDVNQYLFESLEQVDLIDVIYFAIKNANIMDYFEHILCRFSKEEADIKSITACIIAIAKIWYIKKCLMSQIFLTIIYIHL